MTCDTLAEHFADDAVHRVGLAMSMTVAGDTSDPRLDSGADDKCVSMASGGANEPRLDADVDELAVSLPVHAKQKQNHHTQKQKR